MGCSTRAAGWRLAAAIGIAGTMLGGGALGLAPLTRAAAVSPASAPGPEAVRVALASAEVPSLRPATRGPLAIIIGDPGGDGPGPK